MASLAEREGLRGKVQCIYFDPRYGIKFNSNWQVSTQSRDVKDGKLTDISREPEQVKAFRDTLEGRHSLVLDVFAGPANGRAGVADGKRIMDEVFGPDAIVCEILQKRKDAQKSSLLDPVNDYILWYSRSPRCLGATCKAAHWFKWHGKAGGLITTAEI